jgi:aryl carrier-like protein
VPGVRELRGYLERELPPYLIPPTFVELDAVPLNANGKVDRDRLPTPDSSRPHLDEDYVAPSSPVQVTLAAIIATVVGVDRVGLHDNFFEIGGDSILAIQVVAKAQQEGIRLDPLDMFTHPTVAMLADTAGGEGPAADADPGEVAGPASEPGRRGGAVGPTPSDFPLARVDQAQLDSLLTRLAGGRERR